MLFTIDDSKDDGVHRWAVLSCKCNPEANDDPVLNHICVRIREVYGESEIIASIEADPTVAERFNLNAIKRAIRMGLPDPPKEGLKKPTQLTNYRSESTEVLAREALKECHRINFPTHPQEGKLNPNVPILGFDGWGIDGTSDTGFSLVLVQVKGTDDDACPPSQAAVLADECRSIPQELDIICRALSILAIRLQGTLFEESILAMLETIGENQLPPIVVAPVIVRGRTQSQMDDLEPIQDACPDFAPIRACGLTLSIGTDLTEFGKCAMLKARAA